MIFLYFGLTNMPWLSLLLIYSFFALRVGGYKLALGTFFGLGFIVVVGMWPEAMISVYLCGIAVVICFIVGTSLVLITLIISSYIAFWPLKSTACQINL